MNSEVTGIILAGGQSKRMGTNKAFVRLNGKQLIDYALDILKEVTPHVILSVGSESFRYKNLPVVKDVYPGCGPIGGIYSALQYSNTDLNLVISCDLPFVPADLLKFLTEEARNDDADVTLFVDEHGYWQTLCAVYRKSILPQMEEAVIQKNLKLKMIVSEVKYRIIPVGKTHKYYQSNAFLNMNTPEDVFKQTKKQWL
jgi:molybdopterin-guanine dinucleotide biosynthesis protein A